MDTDFLQGGGEMGEAIRALDWSATPLGPIDGWPQSLRTATSVVLASKFPMVIAWGPAFVFIYNDRYRPILGGKPLALGRPAAAIFPEVWDDIIGPLFRKAAGGEAIAVDDLLIPLDRNGFLEECYFTLSYSPIRDETGGVGGMLAVVAETTERVQGERGLRTLRDLAARAANAETAEAAMRDATVVLHDNRVDVPFAIAYLVEPDGLTATRVGAAGIADDDPLAPLHLRLGDRSPWPIGTGARIEVVRGLDARLGCETAVVLSIDRPGVAHPLGFVVAGTNPQRAFDERYRTFFELATDHVATAITNARAYEQERRRAEELAAIDRAKTAFFSNISHEFRTPLTLMLGPTEDALATPGRALYGDQLEAVYRNELRLLKLVNALLDFSRIEAGRVEASFRPTDLARLTVELASTFRTTIERAGLSLDVACAALPERVWVDETMWEKIVLNLLSNAFKFTFEGGIRVELDYDERAVTLRVRDTGTGIPGAELPRVFERFHRIQGARSRTHEGSGIGLALVHELVRLHGGVIRASSELGRGSTFTVEIPRGSSHLPADKLAAERTLPSTALGPAAFLAEAQRWLPDEPAADAATAPAEGASRVLVVDDNADMREYLRSLLAPFATVEVASDGLAALAAARARRPDLVVSDVMMPGLDGFGLLRELRKDDGGRRIGVILVSARAGEESRVEGIHAGADDYIVKPFSARELTARVKTQLELARLHEAELAARRTAESASRAKDEFLAILGHELRNPLTPIQIALDLIGAQQNAPFPKEREIICRQVGHMARLVDDLLDVSRIATGKIDLVKRHVDCGAVVVRALETAAPLLARHEHEIRTTIEPGLFVEADETRLAQVFSNLVTNAVKYTPPRGRIEVSARRDGAEVVVRVRDNGIGIPEDVLPRVFDLFAQERQSIARSEGGLGLGLSIVRSLVVMHGGSVSAASAGRGEGTELVVRLPWSAPPALASAPGAVAAARPTTSRRILVVDDNVDAAELLGESLRRMGHQIAVAFDAPEALELAATFLPEIALLDIGLPAMDGYDLARLLGERGVRPAMLVAISGFGLEADHKRSEDAGFTAHLVKPIKMQMLRDLLARHG